MPTDEKPSRNEDEYFGKKNLEIIHEMRMKLDAQRKSDGRKAHHNKCPNCGGDLKEQRTEQVKIDGYCSTVTQADSRRIQQLHFQKLKEAEPASVGTKSDAL